LILIIVLFVLVIVLFMWMIREHTWKKDELRVLVNNMKTALCNVERKAFEGGGDPNKRLCGGPGDPPDLPEPPGPFS
jgi:uncharacterized membrane protein YqiK